MAPNSAEAQVTRAPGQLAVLQRRILIALLLIAMTWLWFFWPRSPVIAWAGAAFWLFGYTAMLAAEFLIMQAVNRRDPVPRPTLTELLLAWVKECWMAAQVFGWRQPFRPNALPDNLSGTHLQGQRGVVFVHGLVCSRAFWAPWLERLQGKPHAYVALNLEPVFGSISAYASTIDAAVQAVTKASGLPPILVCHSMGGVAARFWLARQAATDALPVHRMVTIGSPHRGTWLARFGQSANAIEMREGSAWLNRLEAAHASYSRTAPGGTPDPLWLCWYSNCDHIVFPASTATLPGAENRLVRGAANVQLAFMPEVMAGTLALLEQRPVRPATYLDARPQEL